MVGVGWWENWDLGSGGSYLRVGTSIWDRYGRNLGRSERGFCVKMRVKRRVKMREVSVGGNSWELESGRLMSGTQNVDIES